MKMRRKFAPKSFILLLVLLSAVIIIEALIQPNLAVIVKQRCIWFASEAINASILSELEASKSLIDSAVTTNCSSDGKITSVVSSGYLLSILKERISKNLLSEFSDTKYIKTNISFGALFGVPALSAKPEIPIYIYAVGSPNTEIDGTLVTTGINQSIYRIVLTYSVEITSVIALHPVSSVVSDEIVLSEIVFSGEVPQVVINR